MWEGGEGGHLRGGARRCDDVEDGFLEGEGEGGADAAVAAAGDEDVFSGWWWWCHSCDANEALKIRVNTDAPTY